MWRNSDFEIFAWEQFPSSIIIFDTKNYDVQDLLFKRLAFYAEKSETKGTLQPNSAIKDLHGFNAHDYNSKTLANFFNKANKESFELNKEELILKEILLANGIIVQQQNGTITEGSGAVISFSKSLPRYLRWQLLNHEGFHGIYFTHESFRTKMESLYNSMDRTSLEFLKGYYTVRKELDYDINDLYLMQNELMAYTLQNQVRNVSTYYKNLANRQNVRVSIPELSDYVIQTNAQGFVDLAEELDNFVFTSWGLNGGRIYLINRE